MYTTAIFQLVGLVCLTSSFDFAAGQSELSASCECSDIELSPLCEQICFERALILMSLVRLEDNGGYQMDQSQPIKKRSWKYFACRCCFISGSESCCNACHPQESTNNDATGISKRVSLMMPLCCREGNRACCRFFSLWENERYFGKRSQPWMTSQRFFGKRSQPWMWSSRYFSGKRSQPWISSQRFFGKRSQPWSTSQRFFGKRSQPWMWSRRYFSGKRSQQWMGDDESEVYPRFLCCELGLSSCCHTMNSGFAKRSNRNRNTLALEGGSDVLIPESPVCQLCQETGHPLMCSICEDL